MPTLGRFKLAQRAISFFLKQTYENKELVVFNEGPVPLVVNEIIPNVKIVNTQQTFHGFNEVLTEAVKHCDGDLINMWEDDNGMFPWFLEDTIKAKKKKGAKSESSWMWSGDEELTLTRNYLEASIIFDMDVIRTTGFVDRLNANMTWYRWLETRNELQWIPASQMMPGFVYCFGERGLEVWHLSCRTEEDRGFEVHKERSRDFGNGIIHLPDVMPWYDKVTREHPELRTRLGL